MRDIQTVHPECAGQRFDSVRRLQIRYWLREYQVFCDKLSPPNFLTNQCHSDTSGHTQS